MAVFELALLREAECVDPRGLFDVLAVGERCTGVRHRSLRLAARRPGPPRIRQRRFALLRGSPGDRHRCPDRNFHPLTSSGSRQLLRQGRGLPVHLDRSCQRRSLHLLVAHVLLGQEGAERRCRAGDRFYGPRPPGLRDPSSSSRNESGRGLRGSSFTACSARSLGPHPAGSCGLARQPLQWALPTSQDVATCPTDPRGTCFTSVRRR